MPCAEPNPEPGNIIMAYASLVTCFKLVPIKWYHYLLLFWKKCRTNNNHLPKVGHLIQWLVVVLVFSGKFRLTGIMATTKMNAPKSDTCWGSSFDLRSLNILLWSPFFFSHKVFPCSLNPRYRLLNEVLCTLKPPLLPCFLCREISLFPTPLCLH